MNWSKKWTDSNSNTTFCTVHTYSHRFPQQTVSEHVFQTKFSTSLIRHNLSIKNCGKRWGATVWKVQKFLVVLRKFRLLKTFSSVGEKAKKDLWNQRKYGISSKFSTAVSQMRHSTVSTQKNEFRRKKSKHDIPIFFPQSVHTEKASPPTGCLSRQRWKNPETARVFPLFHIFPNP